MEYNTQLYHSWDNLLNLQSFRIAKLSLRYYMNVSVWLSVRKRYWMSNGWSG